MERQLIIQDVVEILLHENHGVRETVLLVVSAVVHVGVITEEEHEEKSADKVMGGKPFPIALMADWCSKKKGTNSLMVMEVGISVQSRANLTGVTSSCGSRST